MMKPKTDEILASLDGMKRAEASPFLMTRIRNKMNHKKEAAIPTQWSWRLATVMAVFVLLNILTIKYFSVSSEDSKGTEAVAKEYSISTPGSY